MIAFLVKIRAENLLQHKNIHSFSNCVKLMIVPMIKLMLYLHGTRHSPKVL